MSIFKTVGHILKGEAFGYAAKPLKYLANQVPESLQILFGADKITGDVRPNKYQYIELVNKEIAQMHQRLAQDQQGLQLDIEGEKVDVQKLLVNAQERNNAIRLAQAEVEKAELQEKYRKKGTPLPEINIDIKVPEPLTLGARPSERIPDAEYAKIFTRLMGLSQRVEGPMSIAQSYTKDITDWLDEIEKSLHTNPGDGRGFHESRAREFQGNALNVIAGRAKLSGRSIREETVDLYSEFKSKHHTNTQEWGKINNWMKDEVAKLKHIFEGRGEVAPTWEGYNTEKKSTMSMARKAMDATSTEHQDAVKGGKTADTTATDYQRYVHNRRVYAQYDDDREKGR